MSNLTLVVVYHHMNLRLDIRKEVTPIYCLGKLPVIVFNSDLSYLL